MKGSLIVVGFFALGCLLGWSGYLPGVIIENDITVYVLYLLMFQVGISIGSDKKLKEILSSIRPKLLLVPLATIIGTLSFSALISLALTKWSVFDCLAVGSGFAYYSLSSILITELKEPTLGAQLAAELGTIALIANIIREIFALLGAPLFVRYFGRLSPICAGGATTMDTTLPIITRYCGKDLVFVSIFHGILVDFTVPFFVSFFCSMWVKEASEISETTLQGWKVISEASEGILQGWKVVSEVSEGILQGWKVVSEASEGILQGWKVISEASEGILQGWKVISEA